MRFLLYNIRYGTGLFLEKRFKNIRGYLSNTENHLNKIGDFIQKYNPDIVGLIEVDLGSFRTKEKNQAEIIANRIGHNFISQYKYEYDSKYMKVPMIRKQGNAILSRYEINKKEFHYLNYGMKRLIIESEINGVTIFVVHLALGAKTRLRQIVQISKLVKQCRTPYIIAGDFNLLWGPEEIALLLDACNLENANFLKKTTFPSWNPTKELDFILHSKEIKMIAYKVLPCLLSDHLPILMDFEVVKNKKNIEL